jgi:hypothetical protein
MTLRLLRVTALLRLLPLLAQKERLNRLAFPLWTDSALKTLTRQLTMRVNDRTDLGPRPSPPPAAFGATE